MINSFQLKANVCSTEPERNLQERIRNHKRKQEYQARRRAFYESRADQVFDLAHQLREQDRASDVFLAVICAILALVTMAFLTL